MRLIRWFVIICVIALLAYGASPYFSFWRFTVAIRSGGAAAINSRVDFLAVRASLKRQLLARFARETSGHKRWSNLGPTLIVDRDGIKLRFHFTGSGWQLHDLELGLTEEQR